MAVKIPKKLGEEKGSGCSCSYFPITRYSGVKIFGQENEARMCYLLHKAVADDPKLGHLVPKIRKGFFKHKDGWGYAVERVRVYLFYSANQTAIDRYFEQQSDYVRKKLAKKIKTFLLNQKELSKSEAFYSPKYYKEKVTRIFKDSHNENVGLRGGIGGQLVWIDFSINF